MDRTLTAACPQCQTALRIPAEWAGKSVRCQQCRAVVKANTRAMAPAAHPQPAAPPPMVYDPATGSFVPGPAGSGPVFVPQPIRPEDAFADLGSKRTGRKKKYKKGGGRGPALAVLGLFFLVVIAAGAFVVASDNPVKRWLVAALGGSRPAPTATPDTGGPAAPVVAKAAGNPRRLLAISVTKYLYCNPLIGGKNRNDASEFGEAVKSLAFRWEIPDAKENNQLYVLTDADGRLPPTAARLPMLKPVLLDTVKRFCDTSRGQDRVAIYFGGHAVAKDKKAYLIPTDGDPNDPDTLLPLDDVWAALKACPAQQKVVLFDVCRLSTDDNAVRPGSEPMTEELETLLHTPPAGVQVVTSCSAGQTAGEFRAAADADTPQGSAFLGALRVAARRNKTKAAPADPFPVAQWVEAAAGRLADVLGKDHPSRPKLSGGEGTAVAATDEPPAKRFDFPAPPPGADAKDVRAAFALLDAPPLLGPAPPAEHLDQVVVFPADAMKQFAATAAEDKPWRAATTRALADMRAKWKKFTEPKTDSVLNDGLNGKATDELKKRIEKEQTPIANLSLELDELVDALTALKPQAEKDESAYWRATFHFALAQAKLRLAFSHEANLALGKVRTDSLPEGVERNGVRLVQVPKMNNKKESAGAKEGQAILDELAKEAKGTPWEVAAKQWRGVSLGLEWRVKKADADTTTGEEKK